MMYENADNADTAVSAVMKYNSIPVMPLTRYFMPMSVTLGKL